MRLSESGLSLLREFEGFRAEAYPDPGSSNGLPVTIGYGSTRYEDGSRIQLGDTITRERADELLRREIAETESAVERMVSVPLSQGQFDALVSFAYNVGVGAFGKSTLLRKLNAGDYAGAADELLRWDKNDGRVMAGLTRRRQRERAMFLMATPPLDTRPNDAFSGFDLPPPANAANAANQAATWFAAPAASRQTSRQNSASKPMSPFVIPALDILSRVVPTIADLFKGEQPSKVAERNIEAVKTIADKVIPVVVAASGAPNVQAAAEAAEADPKVASEIDAAARREYYELQRVAIREAREFAVQYAQVKDVRTVVGRFTFLEFLTLVIVAVSAALTGWLIHLDLLKGELLGAVVTLVLVAGFVDVRKFWLGIPAGSPPDNDGNRRD